MRITSCKAPLSNFDSQPESTMTELSSEQQHNQGRAKRTFFKCPRCRKDRKKCEPEKGDWNESEKCRRCSHLGYECGQPESKSRSQRRRSTLVPAPKELFPAPTNASFVIDIGDPPENQLPSSPRLQPPKLLNNEVCGHKMSIIDNTVDNALGTTEEYLARSLAIQQIWLRCELDIRNLDERAGCPWDTDKASQFQMISTALRDEFRVVMDRALLQLSALSAPMRKQQEKDLQLWLDKDRMLQCQRQLMTRPYSSSLAKETDVFAPIIDSTFHDFEVLLCTEHILTNGPLVYTGPVVRSVGAVRKPCTQDYINAAAKVKHWFEKISHEYPSCKPWKALWPRFSHNLHHGFPASHLAYLNNDKVAANMLWKISLSYENQTDIFGRTYAHVAAEAGDLETLRYIGQESNNNEAIRFAGSDFQGRSVLAIAAILGNQDLFAICLCRGADSGPLSTTSGQSILDLAVRAGNVTIVRKILKEKMVVPPYTRPMKTAIMLGHKDVAECFLSWMREDVWLSRVEIVALADLAQRHQLYKLESELRQICTPLTTSMEFPVEPDKYYGPTLVSTESRWSDDWQPMCTEVPSTSENTPAPSTESLSDDDACEQNDDFSLVSELKLYGSEFTGPFGCFSECLTEEELLGRTFEIKTENEYISRMDLQWS